jgi:hypothetical protein
MSKKYIPAYLVGAILSFSFAACSGEGCRDKGENPPCADCGSIGGGAVTCCTSFFPFTCQTICAPDETLAAIQCSEGGGAWSSLPLCSLTLPGETGGDGGTEH